MSTDNNNTTPLLTIEQVRTIVQPLFYACANEGLPDYDTDNFEEWFLNKISEVQQNK